MYLASLKENRIPIFHCPGLVHGLAETILQGKQESRQGCSAVLVYLAKAADNRFMQIKVPGLLDAMNTAIKPWSPAEESPKKRKYVWDSSSASNDTFSPSIGMSGTTGNGTGTCTSGDVESTTCLDDDDDDSDLTPLMTSTPTSLASKRSFLCDNDPNKFVHPTRQKVFATLHHVGRG